jgi:hypothetical protein
MIGRTAGCRELLQRPSGSGKALANKEEWPQHIKARPLGQTSILPPFSFRSYTQQVESSATIDSHNELNLPFFDLYFDYLRALHDGGLEATD